MAAVVVGAGLLALIAVAKGQKLTVPLKMRGRLLLVSLLSLGGWIAFLGLALLGLNASDAVVASMTLAQRN